MKNKKTHNILIWYLGRKGGGAKETLEVAKAFAKLEGYNVFVALSKENEVFDAISKQAAGTFAISTFPNIIGLAISICKIPFYRIALKRFLVNHHIDCVYSTMGSWFDNVLLPKVFGLHIPFIYTIHDAVNHVGEADSKYLDTISKLTARAQNVVVHSQSVKNQLCSILPGIRDKVITIPIGTYQYISDANPKTINKNQQTHLLFFGRIREYKGLDLALEALTILLNDGYNICLDIYGDGDIEAYRTEIYTNKNINPNIRWIAENEIPRIFLQSDIVALPYIEASQSGVIPIAIGFGVPSVCTPVGGLKEQVEKYMCGRICDSTNATSFAREIEDLIDNPKEYYELSQRCIDSSLKYSWNNVVLELDNAWKKQRIFHE